MARRATVRRFGRPKGNKTLALRVVVFTEGTLTEPTYLRLFQKVHRNGRSHLPARLVVRPCGADPRRIVERALNEKRDAKKNRLAKNDQYWAMFDRDQHARFEEAIDLARRNGIHLAISNPCFELWGILHHEDLDQPVSRQECQVILAMLCPDYGPRKTFGSEKLIRTRYKVAVDRASQLVARRMEEDMPGGTPSTTVHELTEVYRTLAKISATSKA